MAVAALLGGLTIYLATRPDVRRPGEDLEDVTDRLSLDLPAKAPDPVLVDVTAEAGLEIFQAFVGDRTSQLPEDMGSGLAWGDFDGDGDDDLFAVSAGGPIGTPAEALAPSLLFKNLGGTFQTSAAFPETRIHGMAAAWADYDGDGNLDLAVSGYRYLALFHGEDSRLVPDTRLSAPEGFWSGLAWGDFDADGDLDLYVAGYVQYDEGTTGTGTSEQYGQVVPYTLNPASFDPERNLLFVNRLNEGGGFTEEALLWGVANPEGRSLSALWHDFDADGRLDLYVANDISDNALYLNRQNQGGTFEDAGLASWVADYRGAMGLAVGDWNRDSDDDLFVTHWIAQENALYDARRLGDAGQVVFSDLAAPLGLGQIALQSVGWGVEFADLDADGWLDLLVVNGSTFETQETPKTLRPQEPFVFWNHGGKSFHDLAPLSLATAGARTARGLAVSDYDLDGDLDYAYVYLDPPGGGIRLVENRMQTGNWIGIRLRSRGGLGSGEGSTVTVAAGGTRLRRSVSSASYLSQSTRTLHFGLGGSAAIDGLEVAWLGGETEAFGGLEINAIWEITEGDPLPRRVGPPPLTEAERRARLTEFWATQRAAMDTMKRDGDCQGAVPLFRQALDLNPDHGDSRYYLGNCLAALGSRSEGIAEIRELTRRDPSSHRAHRQLGLLLATGTQSNADLEEAKQALLRALEINQEETGSLQALGEIALLQGDLNAAEQRFEWVSRTNPRATGAHFLLGYVAWKRGLADQAVSHLVAARATLGEDWKPGGTTAEGDVAGRMHEDRTPLSRFWGRWDGRTDQPEALVALDTFLTTRLAS